MADIPQGLPPDQIANRVTERAHLKKQKPSRRYVSHESECGLTVSHHGRMQP
jgi:hypothetical protein